MACSPHTGFELAEPCIQILKRVGHLCKNDNVQGDSSQAAYDPWCTGIYDVPAVSPYEYPQAIADVGCDGTGKHGQRQTFCRMSAVVLPDLREP